MGNNRSSSRPEDQSGITSQANQDRRTLNNGETNRFIQSLLHHNEELGFIPVRIGDDGRRTISKAHIKKATTIDMPFDIQELSIKLDRANFDGSKLRIRFNYSSKVALDCSVVFGCTEKRCEDETSRRPEFIQSTLKEDISIEEGTDKLADSTISLPASKLFYAMPPEESENYHDVVICLRKRELSGQRKEITDLFVYCTAIRSSESSQTIFKLVCQKKGRPPLS